MSEIEKQLNIWKTGFRSELDFWQHWLTTRGDRWPDDFARRLDLTTPLDPEVAALIGQPDEARILDVGAGPVTSLGYRLDGVKVEIVPTDLLADFYARLCAEARVVPLVPTRFAPVEELSFFFPENSFDLVHCRNALDQSANPMRGIEQMLRVVKVGGKILLLHQEALAEHENYEGVHPFSFDVRDNAFVIYNRETEIQVIQPFAEYAVESSTIAGPWVSTVITKTANLPKVRKDAAAQRLAEYLSGFLQVMAHLPEAAPAEG